ncbi:hypothetical protein ACFW1M_41845 [Streptomyces inhibens]|uniref:hypothetical protein n=1 Tax=Streptomyces inhibens TaxID=2293571 RepID=UPI0036BCA61F
MQEIEITESGKKKIVKSSKVKRVFAAAAVSVAVFAVPTVMAGTAAADSHMPVRAGDHHIPVRAYDDHQPVGRQ